MARVVVAHLLWYFKLLVMLSVHVANAAVLYLLKEDRDVAARAQCWLLSGRVSAESTLTMSRNMNIHGVL